ncbi:MAG: hypothetical protein FJW23_08595 [Acidimicrobiia bacterium]|nr:hypothetical protein [Acidimicrobiia bacterium]
MAGAHPGREGQAAKQYDRDGDNHQSPITNHQSPMQSPIPNPQSPIQSPILNPQSAIVTAPPRSHPCPAACSA